MSLRRAFFLTASASLLLPMLYYYDTGAYNWSLLIAWLLASACLFVVFFDEKPQWPSWTFLAQELQVVTVVLLPLVPVYLFRLYEWPHRVSTDEIIFIQVVRGLHLQNPPDLFALTNYFGFSAGSFILDGWLARLAGPIGFVTLRWASGLWGLGIAAAGYFFYRLYFDRFNACLAALLLSLHHPLIALSRMAMRDNTPVLIALAAWGLLLFGQTRGRRFWLVVGGWVAGLAVYHSHPGRIIFPVWLVFVGVEVYRGSLKKWGRVLLPAFAGFLMSVAPYAVAATKLPWSAHEYSRSQIVLFKEGRELARMWENTPNTAKALLCNTAKGLTAFNSSNSDHGNIYINPGYGFLVWPAGLLLWIGLVPFCFRKSSTPFERLALTGFLMIWLVLAFLTTKNPEFPRLLIILPFVAYWTYRGILRLAEFVPKRFAKACVIGLVLLCGGWNLFVTTMHTINSRKSGDDVGDTARYVSARAGVPGYHYYVVGNDAQPYIWFGGSAWAPWVEQFCGNEQTAQMIDPDNTANYLTTTLWAPPFTALMNPIVYARMNNFLHAHYPYGKTKRVGGSASPISFEVLRNS